MFLGKSVLKICSKFTEEHPRHNKAVNTYLFALKHGSSCYKIQKMCEKAVDTCPVMLECVPNCYKIQEMSEKAFYKETFMLNNCLHEYKSRKYIS